MFYNFLWCKGVCLLKRIYSVNTTVKVDDCQSSYRRPSRNLKFTMWTDIVRSLVKWTERSRSARLEWTSFSGSFSVEVSSEDHPFITASWTRGSNRPPPLSCVQWGLMLFTLLDYLSLSPFYWLLSETQIETQIETPDPSLSCTCHPVVVWFTFLSRKSAAVVMMQRYGDKESITLSSWRRHSTTHGQVSQTADANHLVVGRFGGNIR